MLRVFSGSCLSLDHMDTITRSDWVMQKHILGPGVDFFTPDGVPLPPNPGGEELMRVFSGSALDLNAAAETDLSPVSSILNQVYQSDGEASKALRARNKIQVLVIGDNTYIATNVVGALLHYGYTVRVSTSDPSKGSQFAPALYTKAPEVAQRLTVVTADMTSDEALTNVMKGCRYVIHCGCPSPSAPIDGAALIEYHERAVQALFAAIRLSGSSSIKRLIITGAYTSVFHVSDPVPPSGYFDEYCWNVKASPTEEPTIYAKIVFEQEAWRLQRLVGVELVVLLPSIPIGLSRTEVTGEALEMIQDLSSTSFPFCPDLYWNFVDIQDVAECHVRAMETTNLQEERIIVSFDCLSIAQLSTIMKKVCPSISPPRMTLNHFFTMALFKLNVGGFLDWKALWRSLGARRCLDNSMAKTKLNMEFTPLEKSLEEVLTVMMATKNSKRDVSSPLSTMRKVAFALSTVAGILTAAAVARRVLRRHE